MRPVSQSRGGSWRTLAVGVVVAAGAVAAGVAFQGEGRRMPSCAEASPTPGLPGTSGEESCALPDVALERLDGNGRIRLAELRGAPAVVNFWASWCVPCVKELPVLARAAADLGPRVGFLGVDVQDQVAKGRELAADSGVRFPLAQDPRGEFYAAVGGVGMPTTLFVDAEGTVVYRHTGEVSAARLAELLREHLGLEWSPEPDPEQNA